MKAVLFAFLAVVSTCHAFSLTAGVSNTHLRATTGLSMSASSDAQHPRRVLSRRGALSSFLAAGAAAVTSGVVAPPTEARAEEPRTIAKIKGSGLVFKDTLKVEAFDDPKVKGVTIYVSNFERPVTERLQKDFFSEPSDAGVTAVRTSRDVEIADNIDKSETGEPVFAEKRSLLFKELRVQRIYDEEKKTLVYVSFNTRLDKDSDTNKSRFKSSISAISLE